VARPGALDLGYWPAGLLIASWRSLTEEQTRLAVLPMVRERFEGYLEQKGPRNKAFFNLGFYLRALVEAASEGDFTWVRDYNALVLTEYTNAGRSAPYRLPDLPLTDLSAETRSPKDYVSSVIVSIKRIKKFLAAD
jgi:hypothetical protein